MNCLQIALRGPSGRIWFPRFYGSWRARFASEEASGEGVFRGLQGPSMGIARPGAVLDTFCCNPGEASGLVGTCGARSGGLSNQQLESCNVGIEGGKDGIER